MWVSKWALAEIEKHRDLAELARRELHASRASWLETDRELRELKQRMNWFMHRMTQVELERGQLIQAAIGIKISVPEFVPAMDNPEDALNQMPDLSTVGGDARDEPVKTDADPGHGVDYTLMPGYKGK